MGNDLKLTLAIEKGLDGWFIGQVEEIPGVLTQGKTVDETKDNLLDALQLYLETQRAEREQELAGKEVVRQELSLR